MLGLKGADKVSSDMVAAFAASPDAFSLARLEAVPRNRSLRTGARFFTSRRLESVLWSMRRFNQRLEFIACCTGL